MPKFRKMGKKLPSKHDRFVFLFGALLVGFGVLLFSLIRSQATPLKPAASSITILWIPATVRRWQAPIVAMSKRYNIDPNLLAILMTMESGGDPKADSGEAQGLMQITPATASDIASKFLLKPVKTYNLNDPTTSIEFGAAYLSYLRDQFGTNAQGPSWDYTVELVAAGYNGGPGAANDLEQGKGLTDTQTVVYSRDALNMWRERNAKDSPTYDRWLERGGSDLITAANTN